MRMLIAAVQYSDNFGDGVIFDALSKSLKTEFEVLIDDIDIAGRDGFKDTSGKGGIKSKLLRSKSSTLLYFFTVLNAFYVFFKSFPSWKKKVKACDACFIGGGNLISDVYLNFPLKIFLLCTLCNFLKKDYYFVFVGVSSKYSWLGRFLFLKCFKSKRCKGIIVRDDSSLNNIQKNFGVRTAKVSIDPAVSLVNALDVSSSKALGDKKLFALNVVDPESLHASSDKIIFPSVAAYEYFLKNAINEAISLDFDVVLYTNGANEDKNYLASFQRENELGHLNVYDVCSPQDLINICTISNFVCCTRLHSAIVCYALGTPFSVFNWDSKVEGFVTAAGVKDLALKDFSDRSLIGYSIKDSYTHFVANDNVFQLERKRCKKVFSEQLLDIYNTAQLQLSRGTCL